MTKAGRQKIFEKYGGRCAYCGCELAKGWHVDEIEPVRRRWKTIKGHYEKNGVTMSIKELADYDEQGMIDEQVKWVETKMIADGYENPENLRIENQNPACASCNINKHSMSLEGFRSLISGFINSLNRDSTQYKIAKRYGLVQETSIEVKFYFETLNS